MTRPIELWYWPTPNGWKVSIALEEMGLPYEVRPVNIGTGEQFEPAFQAISPNGRMPAIVDPDGPDDRTGQFRCRSSSPGPSCNISATSPASSTRRISASGPRSISGCSGRSEGLGPMAGQTHHFRQYAPALIKDQRQIAYGVRRYTDETHRLYGVLDRRLADRDYLAGDYSIADMAVWPWILPEHQGQDMSHFPHLTAWLERVGSQAGGQGRPGGRRGTARQSGGVRQGGRGGPQGSVRTAGAIRPDSSVIKARVTKPFPRL